MEFGFFLLIVIGIILLRSIRQIDEYERGVKLRFGKFHEIMQPGWNLVLPIIETMKKVDIRTKTVDVPEQDAITKDNVTVRINAVLYYKVFDASKVILAVENYAFAVSQLAQTTMRNAVGSVSLDELLAERDKISTEICKIIDEATDPWGIKVENVELKDIKLPEEMQRVIAKVAEACTGIDANGHIADGVKPSEMLNKIDNVIKEISNRTTTLGAAQNRIDSAIESIAVQSENITSSLSTLRDADVAKESSNFIQAQILQQAAATLLSTANQTPSIALNLL